MAVGNRRHEMRVPMLACRKACAGLFDLRFSIFDPRFLLTLVAAALLCGCASTWQQRQTRNGPTPIPQAAQPELGNPAPSSSQAPVYSPPPPGIKLETEDSSSQKLSPISPGPILEAPEAARRNPPFRSANLLAEETQPGRSTSRYRPVSSETPRSVTGRPSLLDEPLWSRSHRSTDQRPIETVVIGQGPRKVAVLASLHGDEMQSSALIEQFARHVKRYARDFEGVSVLIVRTPNPDGRFLHSPYNAHGIDLNRNFPSENWKRLASNRAGDRPASEVETRTIVRLLSDFHPELILHVKESPGAGRINCEGPADAQAELAAKQTACQVVRNLGQATSGSMENYASSQLQCPALTFLLPREKSDEAAWAKNGEALLAPLRGQQPLEQDHFLGTAQDPFDPREEQGASRPAARKLPETTNVRYRSQQPDFPAPVPEQGYLELPPP